MKLAMKKATPGRNTITEDGPNLWRTFKALKRTIMNDMMPNFIIKSGENRVDALDHVQRHMWVLKELNSKVKKKKEEEERAKVKMESDQGDDSAAGEDFEVDAEEDAPDLDDCPDD